MQQTNQTIIKNVSDVSVGQEIGLTYSHSNYIYKRYGKIASIKGNTIRIDLGEKYTFPYSFRKSTKANHVFEIPTEQREQIINDIENWNKKTKETQEKITNAVNEFWNNKIKAAEQEQKEQGVYVESETYEITGNGLVPKFKTYGISV